MEQDYLDFGTRKKWSERCELNDEYSEHNGLRTLVTPALREVCERNAQKAQNRGYNPHGYSHDKHGNPL